MDFPTIHSYLVLANKVEQHILRAHESKDWQKAWTTVNALEEVFTHFYPLGGGISRAGYRISKTAVLKASTGAYENQKEWNRYQTASSKERRFLARPIILSTDALVLIMEFVPFPNMDPENIRMLQREVPFFCQDILVEYPEHNVNLTWNGTPKIYDYPY